MAVEPSPSYGFHMDQPRRGQSSWLWLFGLLGVAGLVAVSLWLGWVTSGLLRPGPAARPVISDSATLIRQVQALNELVTVKYVMEKVVLLQDAKWYGENRLLMVAHGVARAGVNLNAIQPKDLVVRDRSIRLQLPRSAVSEVFLDDRRTQVIERSTGLLREFDKDLEQDARRQAVDQIRVAAVSAGMLKDADERARLQVAAILRSLGFVEVEVTTAK